MISRATMRPKGQLTLPAEVRAALGIEEGDEVEFSALEDGTVIVRGLKMVPADQAWFWTPSWQSGEREASEQVSVGRVSRDLSTEDFLSSLAQD